MLSSRTNSKSPINHFKPLFLTQGDSQTLLPTKSRQKLEQLDPKHELTVLKKNYDIVKQTNIKKSLYLESLQNQILEMQTAAASITSEQQKFTDQFASLEVQISKANDQLGEQLELKNIYEHILHRNKEESTKLEMQLNKSAVNVKSAKLRLDLETEKARKAKDFKFSAKAMLKEFKTTLEEDTKKHINYISSLEKNIVKRREVLKKHDERSQRQNRIIELAAVQDRERHEKDIREKININKMLFEILLEKEKRHHKAGKDVENAFKAIRNTTGINDSGEILRVFMTRESTHNLLAEEVEKAMLRLNKIQDEYYESRERLKNLLVVTDGEGEKNENGEKNESWQMRDAFKRLERMKEQQRKTEFVFRDVKKWESKILKYFGVEESSGGTEEMIKAIEEKVMEAYERAKSDLEGFNTTLSNLKSTPTTTLLQKFPSKPTNHLNPFQIL